MDESGGRHIGHIVGIRAGEREVRFAVSIAHIRLGDQQRVIDKARAARQRHDLTCSLLPRRLRLRRGIVRRQEVLRDRRRERRRGMVDSFGQGGVGPRADDRRLRRPGRLNRPRLKRVACVRLRPNRRREVWQRRRARGGWRLVQLWQSFGRGRRASGERRHPQPRLFGEPVRRHRRATRGLKLRIGLVIGLLALVGHQRADLLARQRAAQVTHRPARIEGKRAAVVVNVVQDENARVDGAQQPIDVVDVEGVIGRLQRLQPRQHAVFVVFSLQLADEPRPGVGQALVIKIAGVLCGEHQPDAEGARLFEQPQQRLFAGRVVRMWREEAEHLVKVQDRAQAGRAAERAHPGEHVLQQQRDDEHPLGFVEVRDIENADARLALGRVEQALDIERLALQPALEARCGDDVVQLHR